MMRKMYVAAIAVSMIGLTACGSGNSNKKNNAAEKENAEAVATPQDCDLEDGYIWSELEQRCVPIFEEGISFGMAGQFFWGNIIHVMFSPDSTKAQVFDMSTGQSEILERRMTPNGPVWNVEDDDTKNIRQHEGAWIIEKRGEKIWDEIKELEPIHARFQGSDGVTRMMHMVDATFYPAFNRVKLTIGDKTYELKQYPTASGYGYKNDEVDLRGKGKEAILTFADENMRDLKLLDVTEEESVKQK